MAKRKKRVSRNLHKHDTTHQIELTYTPFKGLKDALGCWTCDDDKEAPEKGKTEEEIFLEAMADVREIKEFRNIPLSDPPQFNYSKDQSKPSTEIDDSLEILQQIVNGDRRIRLSDTGEYIEWVSPRIRRDIAKRLHRGDFSVQDYIDLHGMTLREAEEALRLFIYNALQRRLFCIKVIHGRGLRSPNGPVLKEAFKTWLQGKFRKMILAYSSAKDCDGGLGATYIILKSS